MDNNSERLGSLMLFSDIALILSTYGVLFAFNSFVSPVNNNVWIVCTFFLGIKVLILGIADVTGIGKSVFVSLIFIIIADGVIFLMNQLLAFGLSLRLLLLMTVVDIVMVLIAVLIWKAYARRRNRTQESWVHESGATSSVSAPASDDEPMDFFEDGLEVSTPKDEEEVFNFGSVKLEEEPKVEPVLSFEEITQEIPVEEVTAQIGQVEPQTETVEKQEAEAVLETETVVETPATEELEPAETPVAQEAEIKEQIIEPTLMTKPAHEEVTVEETAETPEPEEVATEEVSQATETEEVPVEETVTVEPEEEIIERPSGKIAVPNFVVEAKPAMMITKEDFNSIIKSLPKLSDDLGIIPMDISKEDLEVRKQDIRNEFDVLNKQLNALIQTYNGSLEEGSPDRIAMIEDLEQAGSISKNDRMIRNKLKMVIDKRFVSDDVLHDLILNTNKISNQSYSVDVAEENINEREAVEKQRQAEKRRVEEENRIKEEQQQKFERAKQKNIRAEERERKLNKTKEEALQKALKRQREQEAIQGHGIIVDETEVRLKDKGMDIIIDKEDLELLKEFLRNQENN